MIADRTYQSLDSLLHLAVEAAVAAAPILREMRIQGVDTRFKADDSPVTAADIAADRKISEVLKASGIPVISEEGDASSFGVRKTAERFWVVDPLDGTKEYIAGRNEYTINIALVEGERPVLGVVAFPEKDLVYLGHDHRGLARITESEAERGEYHFFQPPPASSEAPSVAVVSRSHLRPQTEAFLQKLRVSEPNLQVVRAGSSMKFCMVAEGSADIYPRFAPCMIWDTAAGEAILRSAGRSIFRIEDGEPLNYRGDSLINPPFIAR